MRPYTDEWRQACAKWITFRAANPHLQSAAYRQVRAALKNGTLERQPCEVCGREEVEGHHEDYARPVDVIWLCRWHHKERHQGATLEEMRRASEGVKA